MDLIMFSGKIYSSAFKQCGIIEAKNWQELFDFAKAFSTQNSPKGNKIAVITDGGGFGVLAADGRDAGGRLFVRPC